MDLGCCFLGFRFAYVVSGEVRWCVAGLCGFACFGCFADAWIVWWFLWFSVLCVLMWYRGLRLCEFSEVCVLGGYARFTGGGFCGFSVVGCIAWCFCLDVCCLGYVICLMVADFGFGFSDVTSLCFG